jgi:replication factor C large subunit
MINQSLAEKYRAKKYSELVGQDKAIEEVKKFLKEFPKKKALILHGPAGTGKTSLALAAAHENNLEVLELNSSDLRNRAKLEETLKPASEQQSLFKKGKIILMDEVDGVTGTDIGGIPELVRVIMATKFPIILTCNDVWQSKLSPVRAKSKVVEMKQMDYQTMARYVTEICQKEKLDKEPMFIRQIVLKSQGDLRAALNDLQSYSSKADLYVDSTEKRDQEENIFIILKKIFQERGDFLDLFDNTSMSLDEVLLWVEENIPKEYKNEVLAKAYFSLSNADLFRGRIYKNQSWRFLIYQNIFQSAGISYAKKIPQQKFTNYDKPKRILKIWLNNQKIEKKKSISKKYAKLVHCSVSRVLMDFEILRPVLKKQSVQKQLQLTEEEVEYLNK